MQTEDRTHDQENNGVMSTHHQQSMKAKIPVQRVSRRMNKENEEQENRAPTEEPRTEVESKESQRHHQHLTRRNSDNMSDSVPTMISLNEVQEPEGDTSISSHSDSLKERRSKATKRTKVLAGTKDPAMTQVVDSSDTSASTSKDLLERINTLLTKARGNGQTEQNHTSSRVDDASLVESTTTEEIQLQLQEVEAREHLHAYAGTANTNRNNASHHEEFDRFNELSRLKARLETVRKEKSMKAPSLSRSVNRKATEKGMVDSPHPPPLSPRVQQAMNSEHFMHRLLSMKGSHHIQTEYQEPESKSDDLSVDLETRLISHVRMAYQQNEIGGNDALWEDPMFRLVCLAKELADQAGQIDLLQCHGEHFSRMKSSSSISPSTLAHSTILQNRESSFTKFDPSMDKIDSHPALHQTSGNMPPFEYLLKKLQAAEEECMALVKSKETLEASLMEANNVRYDMEVSVQALKEELEAARATKSFLSEELNIAKEEIAALKEENKKFEDELERTQNRLGDVIVHVSDLELEGASLRQMVDEQGKEIDEDMVLLKDQHQSVVSALDHAREIRHQMTILQSKFSEEDNDSGRSQKLCDDWLKEALPQLDAMDMTLTTCKLELEVKVQPSHHEENKKESSDAAKARWSLFRIGR